MAGSRRRKAATTEPESLAAPLERRVRDALAKGVKRRLGLQARDAIPADVQGLVDAAAHEIAESSVATAVVREVTRLGGAQLGTTSGPGSAGTLSDHALLHDAERLAAKKKALRIAGFSNDEAMRLLVAEVTGLASQQSTS